LPTVALLSQDPTLKQNMAIALEKTHNVVMFGSVHWHMVFSFDFILLDPKMPEYTVEKYMTRKQIQADMHKKLLYHEHLNTYYHPELPDHSIPLVDTEVGATRSFPDFHDLYFGLNFPDYAEQVEELLGEANEQLRLLRKCLQDDAGFSVVRIRDPLISTAVPKRFSLVPTLEARDRQPLAFAKLLQYWMAYCKNHLSDEVLESYRRRLVRKKLLYLKPLRHPLGREKFMNIPPWKMVVMLAKWRTDRILTGWSKAYRQSVLYEPEYWKS